MVGLTPRAEKKPVELPDRCRDFEAVKQGINFVEFKWMKPEGGGAIRAYVIQRKEQKDPLEAWTTIWTAISKKAEIKDQQSDIILDYRVRGLNASGIGHASNEVTLKF